MAQFPDSESEILTLAQEIASGLAEHPRLFPAPPLNPDGLRELIADYTLARDQWTEAQARAAEALAARQATQAALTEAMRSVLRYAESTGADDSQLAYLGWGTVRDRTPLQAPGRVLNLEAPRMGKGWVFLTWSKPADGGKPAAYEIERRELPDGPWTQIAIAKHTEEALTDQPRKKKLEYRVLAVNKAGRGEVSETVGVVV